MDSHRRLQSAPGCVLGLPMPLGLRMPGEASRPAPYPCLYLNVGSRHHSAGTGPECQGGPCLGWGCSCCYRRAPRCTELGATPGFLFLEHSGESCLAPFAGVWCCLEGPPSPGAGPTWSPVPLDAPALRVQRPCPTHWLLLADPPQACFGKDTPLAAVVILNSGRMSESTGRLSNCSAAGSEMG